MPEPPNNRPKDDPNKNINQKTQIKSPNDKKDSLIYKSFVREFELGQKAGRNPKKAIKVAGQFYSNLGKTVYYGGLSAGAGVVKEVSQNPISTIAGIYLGGKLVSGAVKAAPKLSRLAITALEGGYIISQPTTEKKVAATVGILALEDAIAFAKSGTLKKSVKKYKQKRFEKKVDLSLKKNVGATPVDYQVEKLKLIQKYPSKGKIYISKEGVIAVDTKPTVSEQLKLLQSKDVVKSKSITFKSSKMETQTKLTGGKYEKIDVPKFTRPTKQVIITDEFVITKQLKPSKQSTLQKLLGSKKGQSRLFTQQIEEGVGTIKPKFNVLSTEPTEESYLVTSAFVPLLTINRSSTKKLNATIEPAVSKTPVTKGLPEAKKKTRKTPNIIEKLKADSDVSVKVKRLYDTKSKKRVRNIYNLDTSRKVALIEDYEALAKPKTKKGQTIRPFPIQKVAQKQSQKQLYKQVYVQKVYSVPKVKQASKVEKTFPLLFPKQPKNKSDSKGYTPKVKIKGEWVSLKGSYSKLTALSIGARYVEGKAAASFTTEESGRRASRKIDDFFRKNIGRYRKPIRRGQPVASNVFIEKTKYRISTRGEKEQITRKGTAFRRKKSNINDLFLGTRKNKKRKRELRFL